jgi:hypothetical protein
LLPIKDADLVDLVATPLPSLLLWFNLLLAINRTLSLKMLLKINLLLPFKM